MMADVIAVLVIGGWAALTVAVMVRDWRRSRREGTPPACFSCAARGGGACSRRCPAAHDVDAMAAAARREQEDAILPQPRAGFPCQTP